jgi:hypothetical protein
MAYVFEKRPLDAQRNDSMILRPPELWKKVWFYSGGREAPRNKVGIG